MEKMPFGVKRAITVLWFVPAVLVLALAVARFARWIDTYVLLVLVTFLVCQLPIPLLLRLRIGVVRYFMIGVGILVPAALAIGTVTHLATGGSVESLFGWDAMFIYFVLGGWVIAAKTLFGKESAGWFDGNREPEIPNRVPREGSARAAILVAVLTIGWWSSAYFLGQNISNTEWFGVADASGKVIVEPSPGFLSATTDTEFITICSDELCGYIDRAGREVIAPRFKNATDFDQWGLACVRQGDKWGYIDRAGNFVIPPIFENQAYFDSFRLAAVRRDGKVGFIDTTGKYVIKPSFTSAGQFSSVGLAAVKMDGKWGYINREGRFVIEPKYRFAGKFSGSGLAVVQVGEKFGYINSAGSFLVEPTHDSAYPFDELGLASVRTGAKWGYIDRTGQWIVKPQFDEAKSFKGDWAAVKVGANWGFIDRTGRFLIEPKYGWVGSLGYSGGYGLASVGDNHGTGVIDNTGRYVMPPKHASTSLAYGENGAGLIVFSVARTCLFETICLP